MYNLSVFDDMASPEVLISGTNDLTGGILVMLIIVALYFIMFASFKDYDMKNVFLGTSFCLLIIAIPFWAGGYLAFWVLGTLIVLLVVALILKLN